MKRVVNPVTDIAANISNIIAPGSGTSFQRTLGAVLTANDWYDAVGDIDESVQVWFGENYMQDLGNWFKELFNGKDNE